MYEAFSEYNLRPRTLRSLGGHNLQRIPAQQNTSLPTKFQQEVFIGSQQVHISNVYQHYMCVLLWKLNIILAFSWVVLPTKAFLL